MVDSWLPGGNPGLGGLVFGAVFFRFHASDGMTHGRSGSIGFQPVRDELVAHRPHDGVDVIETGVAFGR